MYTCSSCLLFFEFGKVGWKTDLRKQMRNIFPEKDFFARGGDWTPVFKSEGQHSINWATQIVVKCRALFCIWSNWAGFGFLKTVDACNQLMHFLNIPHLNRKGCVINWWEVAFEDIYWKKDFMSEVGIEPWTPVWETSALPTELPGIHVKTTLKKVIWNYRGSTKAVKGWNEREDLTTDEQSVPLALCASPMGLLRGPIKDWQQLLWFHGLL